MPKTPDWNILLIGGSSCAGKTTLAEALAKRYDARYIDLDLFWIVLESAVPAEVAPDLQLFAEDNVYGRHDPDELLRRYIAVCRYVAKACEPLVAHHDNIRRRVIIEGCWILPEFAIQDTFAGRKLKGTLRSLFLVEPEAALIEVRTRTRNPEWVAKISPLAFQNHVQMEWLHGQFVQRQAEQLGLPALQAKPFSTLEDRARATLETVTAPLTLEP